SPLVETRIAVVGKYVELKDSYKSLVEALAHGGIANEARVDVQWVDAEHIERDGAEAQFTGVHGILVPGGFGDRGILGKIEAVRYARERRVPYLGICLGMQCAVIEYARNVCGLAGASSSQFDASAPHLVIDLLPEQRGLATRAARCAWGSTRSCWARVAGPHACTGRGSSRSATVTGTRCTTTISRAWRRTGCASPASGPRSSWSRSSRSRSIRTSSPVSSIPSSARGRGSPIRSSPVSSRPPSSTPRNDHAAGRGRLHHDRR